MKLSEFMQAQSLSDDDMAEKLGISRATVSRYRRGLVTPSPEVMKNIVELSGGVITANDLLGIEPTAAE